jgi:exodeoxyribonuclease V alpha subunit
MIEIEARIEEVVYYNEDNQYTVGIADQQGSQITIVGCLLPSPIGRNFRFFGDWISHPTYGEQFSFTEYHEEMPRDKDGIASFLASGVIKGIGMKTAQTIANYFGDKTFEVIENNPHRLMEIDGIGQVKAETISEAFRSHREFAEICFFLQEFGVSSNYAMKLYKVYGSNTIKTIKENPYQLVDDVFGIGFKKADRIAEKIGHDKKSDFRIKCGIKYVLSLAINEGHTYLPKSELFQKAGDLLEVSFESLEDGLRELVFSAEIHVENLNNIAAVFLLPYYYAEQNVCKNLITLNSTKLKMISADVKELILITENQTGKILAKNQKDAVLAAITNGVCVITGGPGTGKTTIINTIMKVFEFSKLSTAIAAPTGRAAKRIAETTGYQASTIHRLLEYYYSEGDNSMCFGKNSENQLSYDCIIIDEASMVDILLMNGLLNAIKPGTRLIIVGDKDQLPSVGPGNVLRDILESEFIHSVKLTEIFRQAKESLIVVNAHRIYKGEYPYCNEKDKDFFLLKRKTENDVLETIIDLCQERLPNYYDDIQSGKDIQILTPVRKGKLGTLNLNKELQKILNPEDSKKSEKKMLDRIFRVDDKVMQIRNNYQIEWRRQDDLQKGQGVFNGDIGFIDSIDNEFNQLTVVYEDVKFVKYEFSQLDELELAYAVTVHKSQGSEFPVIVMPLFWFPPMLATRNLLYTAVTRAKNAVVLVGSERVMEAMVDNNKIVERYSGLSERLKKLFKSQTKS